MAKTAAQRAQELYDGAQSKVERLQAQHDRIAPKFEQVKAALVEAKAELEFASKHPALPAQGGATAEVAEETPEASAAPAVDDGQPMAAAEIEAVSHEPVGEGHVEGQEALPIADEKPAQAEGSDPFAAFAGSQS